MFSPHNPSLCVLLVILQHCFAFQKSYLISQDLSDIIKSRKVTMKKMILWISLFLSLTAICFAQSNQTETLTITTYYPSPYGVYRNLKLNPSNLPTTGVDRGVMYFDNSTNLLRYYNGSSWVNLTEGGTSGEPGGQNSSYVFTVSGNNPVCPPGTTAFMKNWVSQTFSTCRSAQGYMTETCTPAGGWFASAPDTRCGCSIGTSVCSMAGPSQASSIPCYSPSWGNCNCVLQNWNMVMCT
jgi:hypothetical protein